MDSLMQWDSIANGETRLTRWHSKQGNVNSYNHIPRLFFHLFLGAKTHIV